jgi:ubiquitin carboxyl-terminal hydrolase L3
MLHTYQAIEEKYHKAFTPLESNPEIFTALSHELGLDPQLSFRDVLSLDEAIPYPTLAILLVLPASEVYEERRARLKNCSTSTAEMIWFPQTINNACGLYAIIHAVCSDLVKPFIRKFIF